MNGFKNFLVEMCYYIIKHYSNGADASANRNWGEAKQMLLRQLYELKHFNFVEGPLEWRDALREGIKPLVADGCVEPEYGDCLIANVEKHGPYIVLLPGLAMPHAVEGAVGTNRSAISFMKVSEPVHFGDPDDADTTAQIFFTLSDVDPDSHIQNMSRLAMTLSNEEVVERLKKIESPEELLEIDKLVGDE